MDSLIDEKQHYQNEYYAVTNYIASKAENLWKHDNFTKNHSTSDSRGDKFGLGNFRRLLIEDRVFWIVFDNIMKNAITTDWVDTALESLPKITTDRCIYDILFALSKESTNNYKDRLESYLRLLKNSYGYIVEVKENKQNPNFNKEYYDKMNVDYSDSPITEGIILDEKIFRIKLFDSIGEQKDKKAVKIWFNSGAFHCLKHFAIKGINIAGNQNNGEKRKLMSFYEIIRYFIITGLYFTTLSVSRKKDTFESNIEWDDGETCKAIFYLEKNIGVYSLDTIIPTKKI